MKASHCEAFGCPGELHLCVRCFYAAILFWGVSNLQQSAAGLLDVCRLSWAAHMLHTCSATGMLIFVLDFLE